MKRFKHFVSLLLLIGLVWVSFKSLLPPEPSKAEPPFTSFSTEKAFKQLEVISKKPHYVGSEAHTEVRDYIISELKKLNLKPEIQEGFVMDSWGGSNTLVKAENIVARFKGTNSSKALLLMSHYDSAPHSKSHGASDAGSGVVTVLESLRAYFAGKEKPKNDIIILFTDSEELGLDGATLFVKEHPWAKDVGVALNFEARGSSGPSNMIVETNGGNANLIKAFEESGVKYPVASSLMYSIYKMLPNDTDSTVLREDGDIPGFFFAFIDSHYNYHTINDNVENLDPRTLKHQGSYLLPLLKHFTQIDLSDMRSNKDNVYFDTPVFTFISYPFSWVWPMVIIAILLFIVILVKGIRDRKLKLNAIGKGFIALFASLFVSVGVLWLLGLLQPVLYPQYGDMLPVFIYNGHWYTIAFVMVTIAICFMVYKYLCKPEETASTLVAPLFLWILINTLVAIYIKGAAYFIIPVLCVLVAFYIMIIRSKPSIILMVLLCAPAIFIFSPLIQFFPVGLGPEAYWISILFTTLLFGLLLPVIGYYRSKKWLSIIAFLVTFVLLGIAHSTSDYTPERQKPNSLLYYHQEETNKSYWLTYDEQLDPWVQRYLGQSPENANTYIKNPSGSKYNSGFSFAKETTVVPLTKTLITKTQDSIIGNNREVTLVIKPQRPVNRLRLFADAETPFSKLIYNQKESKPDSTETLYKKRRSNSLLSYYMAKGDSLVFTFAVPLGVTLDLSLREYSFDLLEDPSFNVSTRPNYTMPKPFVVNDAVIVEKKINVNELAFAKATKDTISE